MSSGLLFLSKKYRLIEGLEVKTSENMERWKAEQGRGREKRKIRREKIRRGNPLQKNTQNILKYQNNKNTKAEL